MTTKSKFCLFLLLAVSAFALAENLQALSPESSTLTKSKIIKSVAVSRAQFNPSLNQSVQLDFNVSCAGHSSISVIDRDGFVIKTVLNKEVPSGRNTVDWNGTDEKQKIVPDEAYSFRIRHRCNDEESIYFPANSPQKEMKVELDYFDPSTGILRYKLPKAARVHIQAGSARVDKNGKPEGPVMKTLVSREPRLSGAVIERWNGLADGESSIFIPDQPDFAIAILATELAENSVIVKGNQTKSFLQYALVRKGSSLFTHKVRHREHHAGLTALEDTPPLMKLIVSNGKWRPVERLWRVQPGEIHLTGFVEGHSAEAFAKQPGQIEVFLDRLSIFKTKKISSPFDFRISPTLGMGTDHIITICWSSEYGPVATSSFRIELENPERAKAEEK